ncbi:hypothetical protein DPMN_021037 [Dreissena polymorpha]|uniref:Uncharacterized protein n=1 Tax=Dreissena polymorpha TaxID=45954 RepID=A0A9D4NK20_DREPO|nr:hypothetical protein DPMN_021037 [Dreissena polymorpha]
MKLYAFITLCSGSQHHFSPSKYKQGTWSVWTKPSSFPHLVYVLIMRGSTSPGCLWLVNNNVQLFDNVKISGVSSKSVPEPDIMLCGKR